MAKQYVPGAGEIVWINVTPQAGHEQAGRRPALVLSPAAYNRKTSLMICCPLTTQINWRSRDAKPKDRVSPEQLAEVRAKIHALIG
jgi:mRNA interferase MazF